MHLAFVQSAEASPRPIASTARTQSCPVGGGQGACGRNRVERVDDTVTELAGCDSVEVRATDVLVIETPGGGGYGAPERGDG